MSTTRTDRVRRLAWVPTLLGVLGLAALNGPTRGQDQADPEKQIADVQKQIEELSKKLDALKKAAAEKKAGAKSDAAGPGPEWFKPLAWRALGPANMGGRVVALAVAEDDPSTFWVATAGGGLLRTTNNGITFQHQFDREATVSVGDVAVAPSDKSVVWVGTGEANPRNSVSYGDGVYKSTDGGKTWANMGLKNSYQVGKVVIHPKDPNVVYVGALGRLYGPNDERGLFKTTDGGKTWNKVLSVDENTGVVDVRMSPADPETLIAATYERRRDLYDSNDPSQRFGAGSGLHKTTDGGKTFTRLTKGLPTVKLGRIGLDTSRKDPKTVFAIVESEKIGTGPRPKDAPAAGPGYLGLAGEGPEAPGAAVGQVAPGGPADKAGLKTGDQIKELDGKPVKSFTEFAERLREKKPGDKVKITVERGGKPVTVEATLAPRPAAPPRTARAATGQGRDPAAAPPTPAAPTRPDSPAAEVGEGVGQLGLDPIARPYGAALGGQIENAQDRQGPDAFQTGGVYKSTDGGDTWARVNSLNPRPFYFSQIRVDPSDPNHLYVLGLPVHHSADGGKTFRAESAREVHSDHHALWVDPRDGRHLVLGGDGGVYVSYDRGARWDHLNHAAIGQFYHVALDTRRPYRVYGGLQDNGSWGGPSARRPSGAWFSGGTGGPVNEDWVMVNGSDGFHVAVDPADPDTVYAESQYGVLMRRDLRTGRVSDIRPEPRKAKPYRFNWNTPFLLAPQNPRIYYAAADVVFRSLNRGDDLRPISPEITRTPRGSASALAASPKNPDVLYVGTDDGALWVTRNGGKDWTDLSAKVGLDRPCYVATIEASRAAEGRAYVAFDGHRSDVDDPLVFVTEDFGQTWAPLRANLPRGSSRCLREDVENPDLLYLGTEFAVWASLDRGKSWAKINNNLPTVAVHEIAVHPTAGEVVAATHGRSLWALDVSGLRQLTREAREAKAALLKPQPAVLWHAEPTRGSTNRKFSGQNPPRGAHLDVALGSKAEKAILRITDYSGETVHLAAVPTDRGLHRVTWGLTRPAPNQGRGQGSGRSNPFARMFRQGVPAGPGTYKVVLTVDGREFTRPLTVEADPDYPDAPSSAEAEMTDEEEGEGEGEGGEGRGGFGDGR